MNTFFAIIVVLLVLVGLMFIIKSLRAKDFNGDKKTLAHRDGLPVLPRNERGGTNFALDNVNAAAKPTRQSTAEDALSNLAAVASQISDSASHEVGDTHTNRRPERFVVPSSDFSQDSPILDGHLQTQQTFDKDNNPLADPKLTITMVIRPRDNSGLSGKTVLELVKAYGLKYGVMNMYHRHERDDGKGDLWFSMLGVNYDGTQGFDIITLPDAHFTGLALFLALPHPQALRGFDSMVSVAQMMAKDIGADVCDVDNYMLDTTQINKLRATVADYQ